MKPKPENWKQRAAYFQNQSREALEDRDKWEKSASVSEELNKVLRIERDAAERRYQEMVVKAEMPRPEKIVEKEVLPSWVSLTLAIILAFEIAYVAGMTLTLQMLKEPILSPYPVYIARVNTEDLAICKDAWRENERVIRQLKRRLR
jgi:hypothetical protein